MIDKPGVYTMPSEEYHADPCPAPSLSSHIGRTLITKSPLHAWTDHPRLNPKYEGAHKAEFDRGSAAHALLLEGEDRMQVIDADDYRTKIAREQRDDARMAGKHPMLASVYEDVKAMAAIARERINECGDLSGYTLDNGQPEQTAIWQDVGGIWCRARFDWISYDRTLILDYKTTAASANPFDWTRTMLGMGGEFQGAFYLRANAKTGGARDVRFIFIVQEVEPPYAVSLCGLSPGLVELGNVKVKQAINDWRECIDKNEWPAYSRRVHWLEPPAWEITKWEERQASTGIPYDIEQFWKESRP